MNIAVGCDEAAYQLKEIVKQHLIEKGYDVTDVGVYNTDPSLYPDTAEKLCKEIIEKRCEKGVLMCGTGIGIRAAVGHDLFSIERSRKSNDCQVLCMGARIIAPQNALMLLDHWLDCNFAGGGSTAKVKRINEIDRSYR